jgi:hypothetical protein
MTGSSLVPIITPIVALITLAFWLGIVYWADAHPGWKAGTSRRAELTAAGSLPPEAEPGQAHEGELAPPARTQSLPSSPPAGT